MRVIVLLYTIFALAIFCTPLCADDSLIMYLSFDEESGGIVADLSEYGNDGTLMGGAVLVDGKMGKAVEFNGTDAYVEVLDNEVFAGNEVSLEAWFQTESTANFPIIWKEKASAGGSYWLRIEPSNNRIRCLFRDAADVTAIPVAGSAYNDGQWHHIAATLGDGEAKLYVDGDLENEVASSLGDFDSVMNLGIGVRYLDALDTYATGLIDEVRVWNRPLTQDEIKANMNKSQQDFALVSAAGKLATVWGRIK